MIATDTVTLEPVTLAVHRTVVILLKLGTFITLFYHFVPNQKYVRIANS